MTYEVVMNITVEERGKVRDLGYKVYAGINGYPVKFGIPTNPVLAAFELTVDNLKDAIAAEDGGPQKIAASEKCAVIVFDGMKLYIPFVNNGPSKNSKADLLLSGFDLNKVPEPREIPGQVIIKRIEDGVAPNTAKVFMMPVPETDFVDRWKVERSYDGVIWTLECEIGDSRKLIILNTFPGKEFFVRVTGGNTKGYGKPSNEVTFIPRS